MGIQLLRGRNFDQRTMQKNAAPSRLLTKTMASENFGQMKHA